MVHKPAILMPMHANMTREKYLSNCKSSLRILPLHLLVSIDYFDRKSCVNIVVAYRTRRISNKTSEC